MHSLIISPFLKSYLILNPGKSNAVKVSQNKYLELQDSALDAPCPQWLVSVATRAWELDIADRPLGEVAIVRPHTDLGYGRASYELNLGCNYDCKHCYLGLKEFAGLAWPDRERVLETMREAGVLFLQLTGGEPMIDKLFAATYSRAYELGMMIEILTNGSRLSRPMMLDLLTSRPPHRVTLSVYGASEESYDGLTQRPGAYRKFMAGLLAAHEADISLELAIVVTTDNAHEVDAMRGLGESLGVKTCDYTSMSPTIYGGAESLASQAPEYMGNRTPFQGCDAGHTSFHVDSYGRASICKIGREPNIPLPAEGTDGLRRLGDIADGLLRRQGGCTGCQLQGTCGTCMPLVTLYRRAKAPLSAYCQHKERR